MMTFDKIKELVEDFCKKLNGKYVGVNAIINNCLSDNYICLYVYYTNNSNDTTRCIAKIDILVDIYDMVRINGCIFYGEYNQHSCKYDKICPNFSAAFNDIKGMYLMIKKRIKKEINDNNKREIDKINKYFNEIEEEIDIMKEFRNKNIKDLCESYEKQYNVRKEKKEREELLATVYRYFYDCKNKMKEKDYIDAHISGISVNEDEACGASFYYKTGYYDVYCDYHYNVCSIYVYTSDYKEIKIKGSIVLNPDENMIIDISVNENNYKAMLYMLNEYIEDITTTISGGGNVTSEVLIMNNEKILESYFKTIMTSIKNSIKYNYVNSLAYETEEICELSFDIDDIADNAFELTITNKNNGNKLTSVTISVDIQLNFAIEGWIITSILPYSSSKKINKKGTQEDIIGEIEYIFTSVEMYIKENHKKEIDNMKKEEELKDQYNKIVETVNSIKDKLFIQLLNYDLSKSIKFDILNLEKDNSVKFLITADFTHLAIADVNITMNGLNDIDIIGAFINENKKIDTGNSIHCNDIEELGNELDNIIVNVASTIGKVRYYIYDIEFRQIKDFVWNLNNMILKDEKFKIETIYHNCKDMFKIEFLINSENKNNFIMVEKVEDYKFLVKYELFGLSSFKQFTKNDEANNYIQTLYEKIKHVVNLLS